TEPRRCRRVRVSILAVGTRTRYGGSLCGRCGAAQRRNVRGAWTTRPPPLLTPVALTQSRPPRLYLRSRPRCATLVTRAFPTGRIRGRDASHSRRNDIPHGRKAHGHCNRLTPTAQ